MKLKAIIITVIGIFSISSFQVTNACTNYLVTKGASADGSTMISYAADSHLLYGELYHWPANKWPEGTMMDIHEWDTGKHLGQIKQAAETYNVVGNMNEYQVAIGETTYGGLDTLGKQPGAIMDYGSLIYVALQRSRSAREAIKVMTELVAEYGYYSSGESFSISDKDEVWILELIGKGSKEKGAVWVALRIPDGYVSGHANQARIMTFPLKKENNSISSDQMDQINDTNIECIYAADVVSFARDMDLYEGKDKDFSFSDTYAPVDFGGARFCEIRVWTMFNKVTGNMDENWDYAKGDIEHADQFEDGTANPNHYATNRMPLWVKPDQKVSIKDMMGFMRDHLEGTELDMANDVGAGPFGNPYRWRPLTWEVDGVAYCNERATATQQTGFSFISQSRSWLPNEIGGILWWGVDDASGTVYMPMYTSITRIPQNFAVGNGSLMEWSETSGFWVFNQVQNLAYSRYNLIHPDVEVLQSKLENNYIESIKTIDDATQIMYTEESMDVAVANLTNFSNHIAESTFKEWKTLYSQLFMKFMDGNVKTAKEVPEGYKYVTPELNQPGYSEGKYKLIIEETGDQFKMPEGGGH